MKKEIAEIAANWWVQKLQEKKTYDVGDDSLSGFVGKALYASVQKKKSPISSVGLEAFKSCLVLALCDLEKNRIFLDVDYEPKDLLAKVAEESKTDFNYFPLKTIMVILPEKAQIEVKEGYGAPWKVIHGECL